MTTNNTFSQPSDFEVKHLKISNRTYKFVLFSKPQLYGEVYRKMQQFVQERTKSCLDEVWVLSHQPVYTLGNSSKIPDSKTILDTPVVQTDRGGQITWHGPGQIMLYFLFDLDNYKTGIRNFVSWMEQFICSSIQKFAVAEVHTDPKARGVFVGGRKIASIGLRVRKTFTYHGCSINVCNDLIPFSAIDPCGISGLQMCTVTELVPEINYKEYLDSALKTLENSLKLL